MYGRASTLVLKDRTHFHKTTSSKFSKLAKNYLASNMKNDEAIALWPTLFLYGHEGDDYIVLLLKVSAHHCIESSAHARIKFQ